MKSCKEVYAARDALLKAKAAERRAARKVYTNPKHWLRKFKEMNAAQDHFDAANARLAK